MAKSVSGLSEELRALVGTYFERYDTSANGLIDTDKELMQLVSNLAFSLQLQHILPQLLTAVEATGAAVNFTPGQFEEWFFVQVKAGLEADTGMQQAAL